MLEISKKPRYICSLRLFFCFPSRKTQNRTCGRRRRNSRSL